MAKTIETSPVVRRPRRRRAAKTRLVPATSSSNGSIAVGEELSRRLQEVTDAAFTHLILDELLQMLIQRLQGVLAVDTVTVFLLNDSKDALVAQASLGLKEEVLQKVVVPVGRGIAGWVAKNQDVMVLDDLRTVEVASPLVLEKGLHSMLALPLMLKGVMLGVIEVGSVGPRRFTAEEVELATLVGERIAVAIDHAQIYEREREARLQAQQAQETLTFLAEATETLSATLDYEESLQRLASLAVPFLADWCIVDVMEAEGELARTAVVHRDSAKVELAQQLRRRFPVHSYHDGGLERVLRTGEPELIPEVPEVLAESWATPDVRQAIMGLGMRSAMIVPLKARGRILGALSLIAADSGRRYGLSDLAVATDLARRAAVHIDNARLYQELQDLNDSKDEFLGLVSHELRTPITVIYGGARLLQLRWERLDAEARTAIMGDIEQEAERLYRLVENLLVLARIDAGRAEVAPEPILAARLVEKVVSTFISRHPGRAIAVQAEPEPIVVAAVSAYVEQILYNLLSNADKYSTQNEPVEVRLTRGEGEAVVSVLDRGIGISTDEAERIFDRFYRSDRSAHQAKGFGMGLTVCRRLIEVQGGRVWARPREGGGLEVSFALPFYKEEEE